MLSRRYDTRIQYSDARAHGKGLRNVVKTQEKNESVEDGCRPTKRGQYQRKIDTGDHEEHRGPLSVT